MCATKSFFYTSIVQLYISQKIIQFVVMDFSFLPSTNTDVYTRKYTHTFIQIYNQIFVFALDLHWIKVSIFKFYFFLLSLVYNKQFMQFLFSFVNFVKSFHIQLKGSPIEKCNQYIWHSLCKSVLLSVCVCRIIFILCNPATLTFGRFLDLPSSRGMS